MRRNEEIDRRGPHRCGDPAVRERTADASRDVGVGHELTELQPRHEFPNGPLKRGSG
jgi:hypothetical protein